MFKNGIYNKVDDDLDEIANAYVDESDILPIFTCNINILHRLAYIKRCLRNLALNTEENHTKIDAIRLQEEIDRLVILYSLDCIDDYILG